MAFDLDKELELMNKFSNGESVEEVEPTEEPKVEEPVEQPLEVSPEEPKEEEPIEEPKAAEESVPVDPPKEPEPESKTIAELRAELEILKAEKAKPTPVPTPEPVKPTEPVTPTEQSFITDEEFDEVTTDPKKLNALLNKVYAKATADVVKQFETKFERVPSVVTEQLKMQEEMQRIRTDFYSANKDLEPFQKVVGVVFEELAQATPDKPYQEILEKVGPEVRKRLGITEMKQGEKPEPTPAPRLPNRKGNPGRPTNVKPSNDTSSQIEEMNKILGV